MKLEFLELPADERGLYIEQAAVRRNVSPVPLEKDFWVYWLLGMLFRSVPPSIQLRLLSQFVTQISTIHHDEVAGDRICFLVNRYQP